MCVILGSGAGAEQLNQFVKLIQRLEEEKCAVMTNINDVYTEAKATGFEP
tara:strand:- start:958 stop:1107 length:150 start_codon:yes stop_codon:yes gene_type:complete